MAWPVDETEQPPPGSAEATAGFSAERIAQNDARFRAANEHIERRAQEMGVDLEALPVLCECADPACTQVFLMPSRHYEQVRQDPTRFVKAAGHEASAQQWVRVVEHCGEYVVVEKLGRAAEVAESLDPRHSWT